MDVHVREHRHLGIARIHPAHMAAERHLLAVRIARIIEVVVPQRVLAERGVVLDRRERQWRAAAPTTDKFRRQQFTLFVGSSIVSQESVERSDSRLVLAHADEGAVAPEHIRLWHRKRHTGLARIAEDEFTRFDRATLSGQGIDTAALDRGLANTVLVAERIEVARLSAEVLNVHHRNARKSVILLPRQSHGAPPLFFAVAKDADGDMNLPAAERWVPVLRIVLSAIKKDVGTRSHSHAKSLGKALQRLLRHTQRHQAGIADCD